MKRSLRMTSGMLAVGLLLAGCGDAPNKSKAADDSKYPSNIKLAKDFDANGHFSWAYTAFASSWDPTKSVTGGDISFFEPVYDRLLQEDDEGKIVSMLAEEFTPSADNKTLTLKLKKGLSFSDGTPFNAEAVKFNLDRSRAATSRISGEVYQIQSIDVVDEYTVNLNLSGGLGSLVSGLAGRAGMMVSPAAAQAGQLESKPVGVGPYTATAIDPGNKVEYAKTPNYWDPDAQHVATRTYYYMPDDQTRFNALQSGEVDGAAINADMLDTVSAAHKNVVTEPSTIYIYFMVNAGVKPFDDPEVRKALNMAIDRKAISQGLYDGYCVPQIQPFPKSSPGYSKKIGDGLDIFPYDPKAAKKILESKGVTKLDVTTAAPNVTIYTKFAEVLQNQLAQVGINLQIHSLPPVPQVQEFAIDKVTPTFSSVYTGINDPDAIMSRYLAPKALFNPGGAQYPELVQYGAEGAAPLDPAKRAPAYEKFMDAWVKSPPHMIPVCMTYLAAGFQDGVSGVRQMPSGRTNLREVAVPKKK
ncbi:ABC transporter substrate-binding protein [Cumulibacter manganitolerans]|uniref:ABC transporter substrate-binding protein n=1 Tax=Cumulibacter manganitolerans TaxID=1884992 RepID=UPI001296D56B|nr:ABC transporter substrate-binding protein [Cumulibacter manganitolerans]